MPVFSFLGPQHEQILCNFKEKLDDSNLTDYHGLNSPGLTCYLNSVLQVLFMTEDFREALERNCSEDPETIDLQLQGLFNTLKKGMTKTHDITHKLGITDVYEQRDAAEYFEKILYLSSPGASKIFKGELNHKTQCLHCKKKSKSRSFFWMLPLVVEDSGHQTYSVEQGLKTFFKGETVSEDNRMYCNRCDEKREAEIVCEITQNPDVLTLLLKRFRFDYRLKCFVKLQCEVEVPQTLHLKNCTYELYAFINHYGNLTGGHYTAQIKSFETGVWYYFNDDIVKMLKPLFGNKCTSVKSREAYLLMYRKRSTCSESSDESKCARVDVVAEGRFEEMKKGEDLVPHHLVKEEPSHRGKHFNGDISEKIHDSNCWMEHQSPAGAEKKLFKETVSHPSEPQRDIYKSFLQTPESQFSKMEIDEDHRTTNRQEHERNPKKHRHHQTTRGRPTDDGRVHQSNRRLEIIQNFLNGRHLANDQVWEEKNVILSQDRSRTTIGVPIENTINLTASKDVQNKGHRAADIRPEITRIRRTRNPDVSVGISTVISTNYSPCSDSFCTCHRGDVTEPFVYNISPDICKGYNKQKYSEEPTQLPQTTNPKKMKNKSEDTVQKKPWR